MTLAALNCPQCSAPLPRVALWRAVNCPACGSLVARTGSLVQREPFRQALARAREAAQAEGSIVCGGCSFRILRELGNGENSTVHLARRTGSLPMLVTLKLSSSVAAAARFQREAAVVRELHETDGGDLGPFFSRLLPELVAVGPTDDAIRSALVLRYPTGYWGSLTALADAFPGQLDPRHSVWIWRRLLAVLGYIHGQGWIHGNVSPDHAIVHAREHGVRLIGWSSARRTSGKEDQAEDLSRSARIIQALGSTPSGHWRNDVPDVLASLVRQSAEDPGFCARLGAGGLDELLRAAARKAFGPPTFVPLTL